MSALMDMSQTLALSLLYAPPDATGGVSPNIISIGSGNGSDGGGNDSSLGLATGQQGAATAVGGVLGLGQHNASADGGGGPYVPVLERPETYIVTVLYTLIFIVGVLGNGTLVIIFFRHRSMRNIPNTYMVAAKASIYYLLPLSIIGALYIMMAKRLHISARDMPGEQQSMQSRSQARARRHVARMVVAFVVVFFICFFPYHVFELWYHFYPTAEEDFDEFWNVLRIVGFCTSFLNSCVNPVALYCVSGVFRQHFNRYLCCFCVKRQPHLRQHSTATGIMDNTSVMSMRRSTYVGGAGGNLRASMHRNSNHGGGGGSGLSAGRGASFHGGDSMPMQHSNGHGAAGGTLGGAGVGATGGPSSGRAAAVGEKR
ncbi:neuropeptide CCHamide-2 receptor isoform X2 [Drosophila bipectinata]|uniref:neuropeptide CCHamide-2 receptor isoform X2 n=1 Tax=Drosophila bipectinata TaxID=42026 RepID=UPI001C8A025B|nr:neuropeptide CCHamide-2 receptor isoform X2 [Drosophila bipectinata]